MSNDLPDCLLPPEPAHLNGPLGAHWDGRGTNFAVFSDAAERIELCIFDTSGRNETRLAMPECIDGVWRGYLPHARLGTPSGYRASGQNATKHSLKFNTHNKWNAT